jgi:dienelactone hydrolase
MYYKNIIQNSSVFTAAFLILCILGSINSSFSYQHQKINEQGIVGNLYMNETGLQQPSIIMLGGSKGGNVFDSSIYFIKAATDSGYCVMTLKYFDYNSNGTLPNKLKNIPLEYFASAMDWLAKQPRVVGTKFSVVGNSRGAELALLLGCYFPNISAIVAIVPSAYTWGAFNNYKLVIGSAWSYKGEQIPCISNLNLIFHRPYWTIINKPERVEKFFIPVERMTASLLLLSGKNDNVWPSTEMSDRIIQRLDKFGYSQPYTHISYNNKGHDIIQNSVEDVLSFLKTNYPVRIKHKTVENQIQ